MRQEEKSSVRVNTEKSSPRREEISYAQVLRQKTGRIRTCWSDWLTGAGRAWQDAGVKKDGPSRVLQFLLGVGGYILCSAGRH